MSRRRTVVGWLLRGVVFLALAAALISLPGGVREASADDTFSPVAVPPESKLPATCTGAGLNGSFWDVPGTPDLDTIALALGFSAGAPSATFTSTHVDYPNGSQNDTDSSGTTLSSFLGVDAASLSGSGGSDLERSVFLFTGFISITSAMDTVPGGPIDVFFAVGSDDGIRLRIGGVTITEHDDTQGFDFSTGTAQFPGPGAYPVELLFFEQGGETGIEWYSSIPGGPDSGAPDDTVGIVPLSVLFQICEGTASLTITKVCPNGAGDGDADFNILVTQLEDVVAADALDCGELMIIPDLEEGSYTIRELITGPDANSFLTAFVCETEEGQTVTPGTLATVVIEGGLDMTCTVINVIGEQATAPADPAAPCGCSTVIVPIDLENTNDNALNNDNLNTNNNVNTNTQTQSNEQTQTNDNNQTTTVNSSPSVVIDFD